MIPTPHIEVKNKNKFAKIVIMPGDPLRARYIAERYFENYFLINNIRNMLAYTGTYRGLKISVMGSGMGIPSMGIYAYELLKYYDVENIIRVGSAGSYIKKFNLYDVILIENSYVESNFIKLVTGKNTQEISSSDTLNKQLIKSANKRNIKLKKAKAHCTDVFYRKNWNVWKSMVKDYNCDVVEMETGALFSIAKALGKQASAIATITDSFITREAASSIERQNNCNDMIEIALGILELK